MRPRQPTRPRLRKREIMFAIAMGALGAGGAALILDSDESASPTTAQARADHATYQVDEFEEIVSNGPQDVVVVQGDEFAVRAEGRPEALALLEAVVDDGELVIRPKNPFADGFEGFQSAEDRLRGMTQLSSVTFYVTVPQLEAVSLVGPGDMRIEGIDGGSFEATITGPGELSIAALTVEDADFRIRGSGSVTVAGAAQEIRVSISGSGNVRGREVYSEEASVSISGSGQVALAVEEEAAVSIAGSGDVRITGPAECSVTRMGSGNVRCDGPTLDDDR